MKFYDELSKVYDIVFKKDNEIVRFLNQKLKPNSKILDLACGTGTYSIELAEKGHNVAGMDLDSEMIKLARDKADMLNERFVKGDMRKAKDLFNEEIFNMIFCIGNSLVHIQEREEIKKLISDIFSMLDNNGEMILQIINFDRVVKQNIKSLPTIDRSSEGVKFIRNYSQDENKGIIHFDTELIVSRDGSKEVFKNSVPLLALQSNELIAMVKEVGFTKVITTGDFSEQAFDEKSYALVIRAYK